MSLGADKNTSSRAAHDTFQATFDDAYPRGLGDVSQPGPNDVSSGDDGDMSPGYRDDMSPKALGDGLPEARGNLVVVPERTCRWCGKSLAGKHPAALYCDDPCRQAAWRLRRRVAAEVAHGRPMRFAYADPPYVGCAKRYYSDQPTYAGEVDHVELIASLEASNYDGWALSCSGRSLRELLPLCPPEAHPCPWVKPHPPARRTKGLQYCHEYLIVVGGRQRAPGKRDWLMAQAARRGGDLPGRKPLAFIAFLWDCLGAQPGDELVDLFPGTGIVGRAWKELARVET